MMAARAADLAPEMEFHGSQRMCLLFKGFRGCNLLKAKLGVQPAGPVCLCLFEGFRTLAGRMDSKWKWGTVVLTH